MSVGFADLVAVLGGHRLPPDVGTSKVLRFLLESAEGSDVRITAQRLEASFGWHPSLHRYHRELAPKIVSQLLTWCDVVVVTAPLRATIGPAELAVPGFPAWRFERRIAWVNRDAEGLSIQIRDVGAAVGESAFLPPRPIEYERIELELERDRPCPHCRVSASHFRVLHDSAYVCGSCSRSFLPVALDG